MSSAAAVPAGTVTHVLAHEAEELRAQLPGVAFQALPLRRGRFESELTTLHLDGIALQLGRSDPFLGFAAVGPDTAVLQIPLRNVEHLILNGRRCGPRTVCAYGAGAEMVRANRRPSAHAALFLPADACERLLEPPGRLGLFRPGSDVLLHARPEHWRVTSVMMDRISTTAAADPEALSAIEARHALRDEVLEAMRGLIAGADPGAAAPRPRSTLRRRHLILAADEYLRAHVARPVYTEDLCRALGTSSSALAEAFRATLGISPHRYLKLRRLAMVREALRDTSGPAPLVKAIALAHGFWHLGQFAADYRAQFGEAPSETLLKARLGLAIGAATRAARPGLLGPVPTRRTRPIG